MVVSLWRSTYGSQDLASVHSPWCAVGVPWVQHMVHVLVRRVLVDLMEALTAALEAGTPAASGSPFFADNCAKLLELVEEATMPDFRHAFGVRPGRTHSQGPGAREILVEPALPLGGVE